MAVYEIANRVAIGEEAIIYSENSLVDNVDFKIKYKIDDEEKSVRLYDVQKPLTFTQKAYIYYALLHKYYFTKLSFNGDIDKLEGFENYIVKENGYTYHGYNGIEEEDKGILAELLMEVPRQKNEPYKLARLRDMYEMISRNYGHGSLIPINIVFRGTSADFKDVYRVIKYMFVNDPKLAKVKENIILHKKTGFLGSKKQIILIPKETLQLIQERKKNKQSTDDLKAIIAKREEEIQKEVDEAEKKTNDEVVASVVEETEENIDGKDNNESKE